MALFFPTFGLGGIFYTLVLSFNAVAVLSEDRFLQRVGLANAAEPSFGAPQDNNVRAKTINLINIVRNIARRTYL